MGCFLVSAVAAAGVGVAKHIVKHNEAPEINLEKTDNKFGTEVKWSKKLSYLELTLWGGSFMLAGEHVLHGEVTPFPPFLTAAKNPEDTAEMLKEMGTVGVTMLVVLVAAWAAGVAIYDYLKYRKSHRVLKEAK